MSLLFQEIVAYAAHCKLDQYNRPIAGVINFCPEYLEDNLFDEKNMTLVSFCLSLVITEVCNVKGEALVLLMALYL